MRAYATQRTAHIQAILAELLKASPYLKAAAVVRVSGLTVVSIMPPEVGEERVAAMAAVMLLLGEQITEAMQSGELDKIYIKGDGGHIILMSLGPRAVLNVQATEKAPLGLLFLEMQQAVEKLRRLV